MRTLFENEAFRTDYERLTEVSLNPASHAAANAFEHCEMVRARAPALAELNGCPPEEKELLVLLACVHGIGKIAGTANPAKSVELLPKYGTFPEPFVNLVKYHDVSLSWYQASQKGQPPSDKAWNRMARALDVRLLCIFMVADRVDCPGGWRANAPLVWFLEQLRTRNLLSRELVLDDGPAIPAAKCGTLERSAGAVLVARMDDGLKALLIRIRADSFEVPKGHIEPGESERETAVRELREETGLLSDVQVVAQLSSLTYSFEREGQVVHKEVFYFLATPASSEPVIFGPLPKRTRDLRWIGTDELNDTPLASDGLVAVLREAFLEVQKMSDAGSTRAFLDKLNRGHDSAMDEVFRRYFDRLSQLAARKKGLHVSAEPESIAMSVMGSFVAGIREGRFQLENSRKLWNLLFTITLNKIRKRARKSREEPLPEDFVGLLSREPNQKDLAIINELIEKTLAGLDSPYPEILSMRLAGHTQEEIAEQLHLTRAATRMRLERISDRLERLLEQSERE